MATYSLYHYLSHATNRGGVGLMTLADTELCLYRVAHLPHCARLKDNLVKLRMQERAKNTSNLDSVMRPRVKTTRTISGPLSEIMPASEPRTKLNILTEYIQFKKQN